MMWNSHSAQALAARLASLFEALDDQRAAERGDRATRLILSAIAEREPATLGAVAAATGRGAPAMSRAVDGLVRDGLVDRAADPVSRRRLALRVTEAGKALLAKRGEAGASLVTRLAKLAHSEQRAVERAIEILERLPR